MPKLSLRFPRPHDDRGREIRLCPPANLPAWLPFRARDACNTAAKVHPRSAAVPIVIIVFGSLVLGFVIDRKLELYRAVAYSIMAISFITVFTFQRARYGRRNDLRAIRLCLESGVCPACAYDLRQLTPDADNRTTCPECGAGWLRT